MKNFVDSLYDYDYSGVNDQESSDEEATIVIETISQNQSVTWRLISENWSVTLEVVVKKKTSVLTSILMNQLTWPLIFCF